MNYPLAKRLKDHGYPNIHWACSRKDDEHGFCRADKPDCKIQVLSAPTLEELIEACGMGYRSLTQHSDKTWDCYTTWNRKGLSKHHYGATPLEAVAELYCSLNPLTSIVEK